MRVLAALLIAFPAFGQPVCLSRSAVLEQLGHKYNESPIALGLANTGSVIEVLTSPEGETFTIIVTMPDGRSCLIAAGTSWETVPVVRGRGT